MEIRSLRKAHFGRFSSFYDVVGLQTFDLDATVDRGRSLSPIWTRTLGKQGTADRGMLMPAAVTQQYISVFHKLTPHPKNNTLDAHVVNIASGKIAARLDLIGSVKDIIKRTPLQRRLGPPVRMDGRLCVETCEGITVYGAK